jgi:hypothetical protein
MGVSMGLGKTRLAYIMFSNGCIDFRAKNGYSFGRNRFDFSSSLKLVGTI